MAKGSSKSSKRQRKSRQSSGMKNVQKARQALRLIKQKIKRWKHYQTDETKKSQWDKKQKTHLRSRHKGWDTSGLEKRIKQLEEIIKRGKARR